MYGTYYPAKKHDLTIFNPKNSNVTKICHQKGAKNSKYCYENVLKRGSILIGNLFEEAEGPNVKFSAFSKQIL